ncbi:MAG TPA: TetR/AcrR family transcriptional regulator [Ktedonosporobacter sp.]|nr:TetR/AcrR family transcriptional regulator [Ktedonosporobacter sp.]
MTGQRRERLHSATIAEIKQVARQHMAAQGTTAIPLRAVAEQMGFTSQALYRYFPNRDALLTALIIDAYSDLASTLESVRDVHALDAYGTRLFSMLMAYYQWALSHPVDYMLIYGTTIPDYQEPLEETDPASMKVPALILSLMVAAWQQGQLTLPPEYASLPHELTEGLAEIHVLWQQTLACEIPIELLYTMIFSWSRLHGLIILEICGHLYGIKHHEAFYRFEVITLLKRMGLSPEA